MSPDKSLSDDSIRQVLDAIGGLKSDIGNIRGDIGNIRGDIGDIRDDIRDVRQDIKDVWTEMNCIRKDVNDTKIHVEKLEGEMKVHIVDKTIHFPQRRVCDAFKFHLSEHEKAEIRKERDRQIKRKAKIGIITAMITGVITGICKYTPGILHKVSRWLTGGQ